MDNIYDAIISNYSQMTQTERKAAEYFLQHKPNIQDMYITDIANACHVSPATLTRFTQKLGCKSFNDFRNRLKVNSSLPASEEQKYQSEVQGLDSVDVKSKKLVHLYYNSLKATQSLICTDSITEAVDLLWNAKSVYCFGQGNASSIALDAKVRFSPITPKFHWLADSHLQADTAALLGPGDVVLYFSFAGTERELIETGKLMQQSEAKLILITRFPNAPGVEYCDVLLQCGATENPKNQGSIAAKIAQLYIIDLLFNEYSSKNVLLAVQNREKTIAANTQKMITD